MKYDMHIHSKYSSDGILGTEEIVKTAIKRGLNGIAITDHNTIKGGMEAKKYETDSLKVIIGSEIMTEKGEIIGLFLSEEIKPGNVQDVINDIREQNGVVVVPHPFDEMRHSSFQPIVEDTKFIDCIEGFNSRCLLQKYNKKAKEFAEINNMIVIAGSDAHFLNEIGNAGIITEMEDIREAFLKKNINIFGKRTSLINHGLTKVLKLWRKINSSI
ncbi:MAG TPA: PHP domain-containing protein [Candidatus Methylomirabilis sp.]|nr:PHP domain-containing protein [Candidatus Methylomirabilis sp.]